MTTSLFLLVVSGVLAFSLFFVGSRLSRQLETGQNETRRIRVLQEKIRTAILEEDDQARDTFAATLASAGITTKLQGTRLNYQVHHGQQVPGKYKIVLHLAEQGMAAEEIARIIDISVTEAKQLLSLSTITACRS